MALFCDLRDFVCARAQRRQMKRALTKVEVPGANLFSSFSVGPCKHLTRRSAPFSARAEAYPDVYWQCVVMNRIRLRLLSPIAWPRDPERVRGEFLS